MRLLICEVDYEKDKANTRRILERSYRSHELGGGWCDDFLGIAGPVRSQASDCSASAILLFYFDIFLFVSAFMTICSCIRLSRPFGCCFISRWA